MADLYRVAKILFLAVVALVFGATAGTAQVTGNGYLFSPPTGTIQIHGGFTRPSAGGELFDFIQEELTLGRADFMGYALGADLSFFLASRLSLGVSMTYSGRTTQSEYRDFVEDDATGSPIVQSTNFVRVPISAKIRYYILPRGRTVGSFAWIPATVSPYVGAGAGFLWYRFQQEGDFVDFVDHSIFTTTITTSAWASTSQLLAGADFSLTPRVVLNGEVGYIRAHGDLPPIFRDFDDPLDLSGLSATVGLSLRF